MANFNFNKVIIGGRLTADPELKQTPNGVPVCQFSLAVNRRYSKEGEQSVDFINIVTWRQSAEFVSRYFKKGNPILVCGQLQTRTWTDKDSNKRYATEVVADEVSFVERKSAADGSRDFTRSVPSYSSPRADSSFEELSADDELPF